MKTTTEREKSGPTLGQVLIKAIMVRTLLLMCRGLGMMHHTVCIGWMGLRAIGIIKIVLKSGGT